jgi:hypothetical protein
MFEVTAYDEDAVLMTTNQFDDPVSADGFAAGLHAHYGWDTWVNGTQIFSHEKPYERLAPGVIG